METMVRTEGNLFSWEDWDEAGDITIFSHCTLLRDFEDFRSGEEFDQISIIYSEGIISFLKDHNEETNECIYSFEVTPLKRLTK